MYRMSPLSVAGKLVKREIEKNKDDFQGKYPPSFRKAN